MADAPSLWSGGVEWATAASTDADAYWQPTTAPTSGKPDLFVAFDGVLTRAELMSADWTLGRTDWTSTLSPASASFSFAGAIGAAPNDDVVVSTGTGALWVGRVDSLTTTRDTAGNTWTSISATDKVGVLGQARIIGAVATGTLDALAESLAATAGVVLTVTDDSESGLPTLEALAAFDGTVLEYLNRAERSSNALLFQQPDGSLKAIIREATSAASITVIDLTDQNAPSSWTEQTAIVSSPNRWILEEEDGTVQYDESDAADIALTGERVWKVDGYLCGATTTHYDDWAGTPPAPRAIVTAAEFPVYDYGQELIDIAPLDWVSLDATTWQVMQVQHRVTPNEWRLTLALDQTQNFLVAAADPDPDSTVSVDSQTITSTKSSTVANTGSNAGNGAGDYLAVGRWDGVTARALIQFTISWPAGFVRVKSAKLKLKTTGQVWVQFGSSPKFYVRRLTGSWTEGTFNGGVGAQYSTSNSVVWDGPSSTANGQALKTCSRTENNTIYVDITAIAQKWYDTGNNYGVVLKSANESSSSNTIEFYSDDASEANRPQLVLKCEVTP